MACLKIVTSYSLSSFCSSERFKFDIWIEFAAACDEKDSAVSKRNVLTTQVFRDLRRLKLSWIPLRFLAKFSLFWRGGTRSDLRMLLHRVYTD